MNRSRSASLPTVFVPFMFPTLVDSESDGAEWLHDIKYDGYRTQVVITDETIRAFTRNAVDWTDRYASIVEAARALRCRSAVLDGELCVLDDAGAYRFNAL